MGGGSCEKGAQAQPPVHKKTGQRNDCDKERYREEKDLEVREVKKKVHDYNWEGSAIVCLHGWWCTMASPATDARTENEKRKELSAKKKKAFGSRPRRQMKGRHKERLVPQLGRPLVRLVASADAHFVHAGAGHSRCFQLRELPLRFARFRR